ncbi:hypothetical protein ABTZ21_12470 [Streptomyces sp. NPDC096191]|uniref:hypothetical protein n=1 Tax=Streptomyces sp. NPDC096191 TaxID=3155426 RepID=UPI00331DCBD3
MAHGRRWAEDLRSAIRCPTALLGLLLLTDGGAGTPTPARGALWAALAGLLFTVLYPARTAAGRGWLVL